FAAQALPVHTPRSIVRVSVALYSMGSTPAIRKESPMFVDPGYTPYDLNFSLFGISVRVSPWFWLVSAFFVWNVSIPLGLSFVFLGVACTFVSILVHELGHVLMGKLFGSHGYIVLYSFGGLAVGSG